MDYRDYEAVFNTGDDNTLVERFFCDDVSFTAGAREHHGKDALREFLRWAHDGVREVMRPQLVLRNEDRIFAEVDMDFHATRHRPDFPFGEMRPGDLITVKFFVTYRLQNGKVAELKSMTWPPERGVTKLPRLGAHPSQIAALHAYVAAFSNGECERFRRFYADEVVLTLNPQIPPIHGPDGIVTFYAKMFETVREQLTIHSVQASDTAITIDASMRFHAFRDAPDFVLGALAEGESIEGRVYVDYQLRDGLISAISVRRQGELKRVERR